MHKILALFSGAICLCSASIVVTAVPSAQKPQSFAQWCLQRESVPTATRHTIDVLLKEAGTNDCQQADTKLRNLTTLNLAANNIVDLKPLMGLSNLTTLNLNINNIVDLKPLAGLSNLTTLDLNINNIIDVKPLAGLSNLTNLSLAGNKIVDVKPLAGLSNLIVLSLKKNQLTVKVCPVKPESICSFF